MYIENNIMASIDIIEEVSKYIGSVALPKIDPNTQAPEIQKDQSYGLENAVIPALLLGFYKHTRNEEQAAEVLNEHDPDKILDLLFVDKKTNIIKSVAAYSRISEETATAEMKKAITDIKIVLEREIKNKDGKTLSSFFTDQRSNILKHLPAELNMGEFVNDPSADDRTNKMEGPMSGMMHSIEKIFSSTK